MLFRSQSVAAQGHECVNYWMHNNMITINGQKMGKSLGNFITLDQFFTGDHPSLAQAYSPMTIRFFILMAHYRSTVDFSNEALQAAEKGLNRLLEAYNNIQKITPSAKSTVDVAPLRQKMFDAMNDDLNSPIVISHLFECANIINRVIAGNDTIDAASLEELKAVMSLFMFDILGLKNSEAAAGGNDETYGQVVDMVLQLRNQAKANKDWATADLIRNRLAELGFQVKDTKDGVEWKL